MKAIQEDLKDIESANQRFRKQAFQYGFEYRCESCAHIVVSTALCSLGYPNEFMKGKRYAIKADGNLTFCKYFELGERTQLRLDSATSD